MTFRARLLACFLIVVLAPLLVLAIMIPREMKKRFTAQYSEVIQETMLSIRQRLANEDAAIVARLAQVAKGLRDDNSVRRAIVSDVAERSDLLDFGSQYMLRTGLTMLQVQNDSGRILSSGHFRNEYDQIQPDLPYQMLSMPRGTIVVRTRMAGAPVLTLARADTVHVGTERIRIVGGTILSDDFARSLSQDKAITVTFATADTTAPGASVADSISLPYLDDTVADTVVGRARLYITHSTAELDAALRDVRSWILGTILVAIVAALAAALWLASWLSNPLSALAAESARMDLDNPRNQFSSSKRKDEVGVLARRLASMIERMRASATRLSDAERRATVGDVARQVNHDIKNGLTPIRNVVRHLAQVAHEAPAELPVLFKDRQQTLESSIEYLDTLARNYAKLSPRLDVAPCNVRPVVEDVVRSAATRGATVNATFSGLSGKVVADAAVLRRILENLVGNAIDALEGKPGEVTVAVASAGKERDQPMLRIVVSDTGRGMTPQELQKAFDDFYTTKSGGTGLGLSVVRRLVADLSGILRVETEPQQGTRVIIDIPSVAESGSDNSKRMTSTIPAK